MEETAALIDPLVVSSRFDQTAPFEALAVRHLEGETIEWERPEIPQQLAAAAEHRATLS